jgi:hypothetical protein
VSQVKGYSTCGPSIWNVALDYGSRPSAATAARSGRPMARRSPISLCPPRLGKVPTRISTWFPLWAARRSGSSRALARSGPIRGRPMAASSSSRMARLESRATCGCSRSEKILGRSWCLASTSEEAHSHPTVDGSRLCPTSQGVLRSTSSLSRARDQKLLSRTRAGSSLFWGKSGRELYYRAADALMEVPLRLNPLQVTAARKLLDLPRALYGFDQFTPDHDVAADGRFLAIRRDASAADEITVVLNWTQELRRALGR